MIYDMFVTHFCYHRYNTTRHNTPTQSQCNAMSAPKLYSRALSSFFFRTFVIFITCYVPRGVYY